MLARQLAVPLLISPVLCLQMFKRGGMDEVCSLLCLIAQEQGEPQPDQASSPAEPSGALMPSQHGDTTADADTGAFALVSPFC